MSPPVNLVSLEKARLTLGQSVLLDDVSCGVAGGMRLGVVGRNGGGKTTLLRVLGGEQGLDGGRAVRTGDLTVGFLSQADDLDPGASVRKAALGDAAGSRMDRRPTHQGCVGRSARWSRRGRGRRAGSERGSVVRR